MRESRMERPDGVSIYYKVWDDVSNPVGVLQIAHGMGEYIERYDPFARYLNRKGIIVYGNDHRGHGKTIGSTAELDSFGERNTWQKVVENCLVHDAVLKVMGLQVGTIFPASISFVRQDGCALRYVYTLQ